MCTSWEPPLVAPQDRAASTEKFYSVGYNSIRAAFDALTTLFRVPRVICPNSSGSLATLTAMRPAPHRRSAHLCDAASAHRQEPTSPIEVESLMLSSAGGFGNDGSEQNGDRARV
jgi:hypothetical protein